MKKPLIKVKNYLGNNILLFIFLGLVIFLRIPNFFEPYWHTDSGVYLTIGQAIRNGQKLYVDIADHKPPIIYYLATVSTQLNFKLLLLGWVLVSTTLFYTLAKKIFAKDSAVIISTTIFILLTTLPTLEGNVPNAELFFTGFVLAGFWVLSKTSYLKEVLVTNPSPPAKESCLKFLAGIFFGLATLTKIPAMFDFLAFLLIPWFICIQKTAKKTIPLLTGFVAIVALSVAHQIVLGAGQEYLRFGLLYNLRYTRTWKVELANPFLNFLFTLPGKTVLLALFFGTVTALKKTSVKIKFLLTWAALSFYSALLSNRPYPHYLIQTVAPTALLIATLTEKYLLKRKTKAPRLEPLAGFIVITLLFLLGINAAGFKFPSSAKYYYHFVNYASGNITKEKYHALFSPIAEDNYKLAKFLQENGAKRLFIWGRNPNLYALSQTIPVGRYVVSFQVEDLNARQETLEAVTEEEPNYIVVMKKAPDFKELEDYLEKQYSVYKEYKHLTLYQSN